MRQVQLQEAEEQFAALIAEPEAGESLTILRGGKPVIQILPRSRCSPAKKYLRSVDSPASSS